MIRLTREIKVLLGDNNGKFPFCNCLFIDDDVKAVIDTGCGGPVLEKAAGEFSPETVILSHYHLDHMRDAASLELPVYCHAADIPPVENEKILLDYTSFSELGEAQAQMILKFLKYQPVEVRGSFADGDILDFGRTRLQVIHTPGHSPGHCCFYAEKEGILFSADIDLTSFGPWYGHNSCEIDAFENSIKKLMGLSPTIIITGHSDIIRDGGGLALKAYLKKIAERDETLLECLASPATLEELVDKRFIYGKHPEPVFLYRHFERKMLKQHLDRLFTRGQIRLEGDVYRRLEKRQKFFGGTKI